MHRSHTNNFSSEQMCQSMGPQLPDFIQLSQHCPSSGTHSDSLTSWCDDTCDAGDTQYMGDDFEALDASVLQEADDLDAYPGEGGGTPSVLYRFLSLACLELLQHHCQHQPSRLNNHVAVQALPCPALISSFCSLSAPLWDPTCGL